MKIFSSFDTQYKKKLITDKQSQFGSENVHLVWKSGLFLFVKVYFPIIVSLILGILTAIFVHIFLQINYELSSIIWIIMAFFMIIPYRIIKHYIDYKMDYCIITPFEIILAEQSGVFKRQLRTLDATKIKSISIYKRSTIKSIFNNGVIVFMSDGDDNNLWEIQIDYIYNPEEHKNNINRILDNSHEKNIL